MQHQIMWVVTMIRALDNLFTWSKTEFKPKMQNPIKLILNIQPIRENKIIDYCYILKDILQMVYT